MIKPIEEWRPIEGFPGYQVSSLGRIQSLEFRNGKTRFKREEPLVLKPTNCGNYAMVTLCRDGRVYTRTVHGLVIKAFHGQAPKGYAASHLNGDAYDNRAANLAWMTQADNCRLKAVHGTSQIGSKNGNSKLTEDQVLLIRSYKGVSPRQTGKLFGVSEDTVRRIIKRQAWGWL